MRYPVTWRLLLIALATVVVGQVTVDVDVTSLCRRPSRSSVALNNATWDVLLSGESAGQNTTVMVGVTVMEAFSKGFVTLGLGNRTIVTYNLCGLTQCPLRANSNISLSMLFPVNETSIRTAPSRLLIVALWELDQANATDLFGCWNIPLQPPLSSFSEPLSNISIITIVLTSITLAISLVASIAWHVVLRKSETTHFELSPTGGVSLTLASAEKDSLYPRTPFPTFIDVLLYFQFIGALGMIVVQFPRHHFDLVRTYSWFLFLFGYLGVDRAAISIQNLGGSTVSNSAGPLNTTSSSLPTSTTTSIDVASSTTSFLGTVPTQALTPCSPDAPGSMGICNIVGYCCSVSGYCGVGPEYCANGGGPPFEGTFASRLRLIPRRPQDLEPTGTISSAIIPTSTAAPTFTSFPVTATAGPNIAPTPSLGIDRFVVDSISHLSSGGTALGSTLLLSLGITLFTCLVFAVLIPSGFLWVRWSVTHPKSRSSSIRTSTPVPSRPASGMGSLASFRYATDDGENLRPGSTVGMVGARLEKDEVDRERALGFRRWLRWLWLHFWGLILQIYIVAFFPILVFSFHELQVSSMLASPRWQMLLLASVIVLGTFVALFLLIVRVMRVVPNERLFTEKSNLIKFGSLYASYKPSTLFFFILPFAHRTIIALMIGGIRNPILQISIVVVIEALHLACILAFTPYSRPIGNVLAILLSFTRCVSTGLIFPYVISESKRSPAESSTVNVAGWSFVGVQMVVVIAFIGCGVFNVVTAGFRIRETAEDSKSRGSFRSSSAMSIDPVSQTRNEAGNGDDRSQSRWTKVLSGVSFSAMSGVSTSRPDEGDERGIMETPLPAPSSASIDPRSGRGSKTPLLHHAQSYTSLGSSLNHRISVVHPPRPPSNASHVSSFMAQPRVVVPPPLQKVEGVVVTGMVNSPVTASPATRDDSGFLVSDGEGAKILSGTEIKQQSGSKRDSETIMGILKRAMSRKKSRRSRSTVKIMRPEPVDYDVEGLDSYLKEKPVGFGGMLHWRNSGDARSIRRDEDVALQDLGMRKSDSRDITGQADFVPVPPPIPAAYIVATEPVPVVPLVLPPQGVPPLASVLLVSNLPPGSRSSSPSIAGSASSFRASVLSTNSFLPPPVAPNALSQSPRASIPPWSAFHDTSPKRPTSSPPLSPTGAERNSVQSLGIKVGQDRALPWLDDGERPGTPELGRGSSPHIRASSLIVGPSTIPQVDNPRSTSATRQEPPRERWQTRPSSYQAGTQAMAMVANAIVLETARDDVSMFSTLPSRWDTLASEAVGSTRGREVERKLSERTVRGREEGTVKRGMGELETIKRGEKGGDLGKEDGLEMTKSEVIAEISHVRAKVDMDEPMVPTESDDIVPMIMPHAAEISEQNLVQHDDVKDETVTPASPRRSALLPSVAHLVLTNPDSQFTQAVKERIPIEEFSDDPGDENEAIIDGPNTSLFDDEAWETNPTLDLSFTSWARRRHTVERSKPTAESEEPRLSHADSVTSLRSHPDAPIPLGGFKGGAPVLVNPDQTSLDRRPSMDVRKVESPLGARMKRTWTGSSSGSSISKRLSGIRKGKKKEEGEKAIDEGRFGTGASAVSQTPGGMTLLMKRLSGAWASEA